jgi:xanthine dehydrogenase small subunit
MLRYFGARQIKHRATIGGNLCNASPIGDLAPVLLALDASAVIAGPSGRREVPFSEFFVGYRQTALGSGELLAAVRVHRPDPSDRVGAYKVSRRRELDISAVSAAMWVRVDGESVAGVRLAYGGMAATPARARATEAALLGGPWTLEAVQAAAARLADDFTPLTDHRGSAWFRATLARNLLLGFFEETAAQPFVPLPERHVGTVVLPEGR